MPDLQRFLDAQGHGVYERAMSELARGRKQSHWMWFVFPQIAGLGQSPTAVYYSIGSLAEARAYLEHKSLGPRLRKACEILLGLPESDPKAILGLPDDLKLRSSMTLFDHIAPNDVFAKVLEKFYAGMRDEKSLEIIAGLMGCHAFTVVKA